VTENVVCGGDLAVGNLSTIHGAVKVYGSMRVDERVVFLGPVVVNGDLDAPSGCVFMSDVVVKGDMRVAGYHGCGPTHAPFGLRGCKKSRSERQGGW
jgi:UDP-3-O-[3-hydroxymyristoyl] glucosamine N-acyltransferase